MRINEPYQVADRVMIVEDSLTTRKLLQHVCSNEGYDTICHEDGEAALDSIEQSLPDIVLLDISLPGSNGFEVCQSLKSNPETKDIPIVFLSANNSSRDKVEAFRNGGVDYITKPFFPAELAARVKAQLALRSEMRKRVEAEKALIASKNQIQNIFDATPVPLFVTEIPTGKVIKVNEKAIKVFGLWAKDMEHLNLLDLILDELRREELESIFESRKSKVINEIEMLAANSQMLWYSLSARTIDFDGKPALLAGFYDITARKESQLQLEKAIDEAKAANKAKSAFLAMMSHEIRSPMNGVIGMVEILLKTPLQEQQLHYARTVRNSADHLLTIINDILDFSKHEAGNVELEKIPFEFESPLQAAINMLKDKADEKGLNIVFEKTENTPEVVLGDPVRITQIVTNLVSNAIKFTEHGKIQVSVQQTSESERFQFLEITVTDSGIGMTPEQQAKLFRPFIQADVSTTRKYGGTGLGLSICKSLSELMKGSIKVRSRAGEGTSFIVSIKLGKANEEECQQVLASTRGQVQNAILQHSKKLRILLAEDGWTNQEIAKIQVESMGHEISIFENGKLAVEALNQNEYDCVLMDVHMPEMDGVMATEAIRAKTHPVLDHDIYIIAMSAAALKSEQESFLAAGMNDVVPKPVIEAELAIALQGAIDYQTKRGVELPEQEIKETAPATLEMPVSAEEVEAMSDDDLDKLFGLGDEEEEVSGAPPQISPAILNIFLQEMPLRLNDLKEAYAQDDMEGMRRAAHTIGGSSAQVKEDILHQQAKAAEQSVIDKQIDNFQAQIEMLEATLQEVQSRLASQVNPTA